MTNQENTVGKFLRQVTVACLPLMLVAATMLPGGGEAQSQVNKAGAPKDFTGPRITLPGGRFGDTPRFGANPLPFVK